MQTANCHVRLSGDINNEIFKAGVTVAEIVVLRAIHGDDAVVKVQGTGNDKRAHAAELDRLKQTYGAKFVDTMFPGAYPKLPVNFKDIGINVVELLNAPGPKAGKDDKAKGADTGAEEVSDGDDAGAQE